MGYLGPWSWSLLHICVEEGWRYERSDRGARCGNCELLYPPVAALGLRAQRCSIYGRLCLEALWLEHCGPAGGIWSDKHIVACGMAWARLNRSGGTVWGIVGPLQHRVVLASPPTVIPPRCVALGAVGSGAGAGLAGLRSTDDISPKRACARPRRPRGRAR